MFTHNFPPLTRLIIGFRKIFPLRDKTLFRRNVNVV